MNSLFLQIFLQFHLLYQSKQWPFVSHSPFLHDSDNSLHIHKSLEKFLPLLLQAMQVDNCLMYSHELLIEVSHGLSKCWYFTNYNLCHFPQVDLCRYYVLCYFANLFYLFLGTLYWVFDVFSSGKEKLASAMGFRFLLVSDTISLSLMNVGDAWPSKKCSLRAYPILFWSSLYDKLYISIPRSSSRGNMSPSLLTTNSMAGGGGDWMVTCGALGIKSASSSCGSVWTPCPRL